MITSEYQESRIAFAAVDVPDLYAVHQRVMAATNGDNAVSYGPVGHDGTGRMVVALRSAVDYRFQVAMEGVVAERKAVEAGMIFQVRAGVRLVKRSDRGERMPTEDEALEKWTRAVTAGGFSTENTEMAESNITFFHQRLKQNTRLPFWAVSSQLTVVDAEKAAATMVRGVGRSRGLGFGMLMVVG